MSIRQPQNVGTAGSDRRLKSDKYNDDGGQSPLRTGRFHRETNAIKYLRITVNSQQMGGVPCIRGLRIPVAKVIEMVADGMTPKPCTPVSLFEAYTRRARLTLNLAPKVARVCLVPLYRQVLSAFL
jgi:hypothetical protein